MILSFILLWTLSLILIFNQPHRDNVRWGAASAFLAGIGAFSVAWTETFEPNLNRFESIRPWLSQVITPIVDVGLFMYRSGMPYAFLMFAVCYSGFFGIQFRRMLSFILLVPVISLAFLAPIDISATTKHPSTIWIAWTAVYLLAGCLLLFVGYLKQSNPVLKRKMGFLTLIVVPVVVFHLFAAYILLLFGIYDIWRFNDITLSVFFIVFLLLMTKTGFLGIRLKFENERLDSAMKAMTSGTSIINHTIKSDIGKINLLMSLIKQSVQQNDSSQIQTMADDVLQTTDHLYSFAMHIQKQIQDMDISMQKTPVRSLIEQALELLTPQLKHKRIAVSTHYSFDGDLECDPVHIREVLGNIMMNAMEAMPHGGKLTVTTDMANKQVAVTIKDTGTGIPRQHASRIMEPFYTTKNRAGNFGLGLSYCYNMMRKHGGHLSIHSRENEGTTVTLQFPTKFRKAISSLAPKGETIRGQNQRAARRGRSGLESGR